MQTHYSAAVSKLNQSIEGFMSVTQETKQEVLNECNQMKDRLQLLDKLVLEVKHLKANYMD